MDELKKIIEQSNFIVHAGQFVYAKVKTAPELKEHFFVSHDKDEITVVTKEENLPKLDLIERNKEIYSLIELKVSVPFYAVGFLATVSSDIAKEKMNILIVSTYSKDYILVKHDRLKDAIEVLRRLGFKE